MNASVDGKKFFLVEAICRRISDGLFPQRCATFDVDDEDAAFAYAEERIRAVPSRLAVRNRAGDAGEA